MLACELAERGSSGGREGPESDATAEVLSTILCDMWSRGVVRVGGVCVVAKGLTGSVAGLARSTSSKAGIEGEKVSLCSSGVRCLLVSGLDVLRNVLKVDEEV